MSVQRLSFDPRGKVLAIVGPTAVGKTDAAIALAERYPVDLISMDSALIYRDMDIGTAKPDLATQRRYPHALLDIRDPSQSYSAAEFVADADALVRGAWAKGRLPVLVGGTMLYLRAFRQGLAELPSADPAIRQALLAEAEARGWPALHQELQAIDPEAASGRRGRPRRYCSIPLFGASRAMRALPVVWRLNWRWWRCCPSRGRRCTSGLCSGFVKCWTMGSSTRCGSCGAAVICTRICRPCARWDIVRPGHIWTARSIARVVS